MAPFRFVGRALRRMMALALFGLIRGRRVVLAVAAVAIVGWFALLNVGRLPGVPAGSLPSWVPGQSTAAPAASGPPRGGAAGAPLGRLRPISAEAVPSVDSYIKGLTQFDAKLMWGSLSDDAISTMRSRGGSLEALQKGLDDARGRGARYEDVTMIGNYPLPDGGKYLFYVMSRRGFAGPDQLDQIYFIFTVDGSGKIASVA